MFSLVSRTITHRRMPRAPSAAACLSTSMVAKLSPASWNDVMPFCRLASTASSIWRRASAARSSGVFFANQAASAPSARSDAVSRSTPIGRPLASFRISPPGGFFVVGRDAGGLHGLGVDVAGVAAGVFQEHRVVRRHLAEQVVEREAFHVGLRHRRSISPGASRVRGSSRRAWPWRPPAADAGDDLLPAGRVHQVDDHARLAEAHEVAVRLR